MARGRFLSFKLEIVEKINLGVRRTKSKKVINRALKIAYLNHILV